MPRAAGPELGWCWCGRPLTARSWCWAAPLSPFEITVGRLACAAVLVWLLARLNGQPLLPRRADLPALPCSV